LFRPRDFEPTTSNPTHFDELKVFLETVGLIQHLNLFIEHDVTLKGLLSFTANDFDRVRATRRRYIATRRGFSNFFFQDWPQRPGLAVDNHERNQQIPQAQLETE
jgi:hypothetical protein